MKPVSDDLHQLVHALSPTEKRYLKIRIEGESDARYLQLLKLIEQQEVYDEGAIVARFRDSDPPVNISMMKKYLETFLIGVICDYHGASSELWRNTQAVFAARFLYEKGLAKMARRLLRSAQDMAGKREAFPQRLIAARSEMSYIFELGEPDIAGRLNELYEDGKRTVDALSVENEYVYLLSESQRLMRAVGSRATGDAEAAIRRLLMFPHMNDDAPQTARQRITYTSVKSRLHMLLGEIQLAFEYSRKNVIAWEQMPNYTTDHLVSYAGALNNAANRALYARQIEEARLIRAKLGGLPAKTHEMKLFSFHSLTQLDIVLCLMDGRFDEFGEIVKGYEKQATEFERYSTPYILRNILVNIAQIYLLMNMPDEALAYTARVINDTSIHDSNTAMASILSIIAHAMLGNEATLESIARSYQRGKRDNRTLALERDLSAVVWKIARGNITTARVAKVVDEFLGTYAQELNGRSEEGPFALFAVVYWIQSLRNGTTITDTYLATVG